LKEEALDGTMWRNRFGRGVGPVVRQITEWMNNWGVNHCLWQMYSNKKFNVTKKSELFTEEPKVQSQESACKIGG
jgi:hypothetical protein